MGVETDSGPSKTVTDKNLVRTDAKEQKLDKFITVTPRAQQDSEVRFDADVTMIDPVSAPS